MVKEIEQIITSNMNNLLDASVDLADYIVDKYMYSENDDVYFVYKKKFVMIPLLLEDFLKNNKKKLGKIIEIVEKEINKLKMEIYNDWKKGILSKDKNVNIQTVKKISDKMYYNLIKQLPTKINKETEKEVKILLNIKKE